MASRLDRLVSLLDSGATALVRSTAARQIGGIQRQHPEELFRLLGRVYSYIGSRSWDTRVAATQALEAIAKEVAEWDPNSREAKVKDENAAPEEDSVSELLRLEQFDVDSVIGHGRLLLGSAGREYEDSKMEGMDAQTRVAVQRAQMRKQLGLGAQFMDVDLLDEADVSGPKPCGIKRKASVPSEPQSEPAIEMGQLSARERNRLKRKARLEKKKARVDLGPKGGSTNEVATGHDVTEQPGGQAIVVEAKRADSKEAVFAISAGRWAFEALVEVLCADLFDAAWETRHGAGMALREIFKYHGFGAGRAAGVDAAENARRNQQFLEDVCVRLLCVFTLDRFGDFVSDHVVAPVRETCAQALGVVSQFLTQSALVATREALLGLVARGAQEDAAIWEVRHAGLLGLKYIVAVRRDMAPLMAAGTLDAALAGLRDHDDDVRAVSASTLLPLVDTLVTCQPARIIDVINGVWAALTDLGDDLTASVASVMDLLASLFSQPQVRACVVEAGHEQPERYAFAVLIPRLHPFFRHTIASVRRATLQTLLTFASMQAAHNTSAPIPPWVDPACLRLVLQNIMLETDAAILDLSIRLWLALLAQLKELSGSALLSPSDIANAFTLMSTPVGTPLDKRLLYDPSATPHSAAARYSVDASMVNQDLGLISRETIMRCRVHAASALGLLMAAWPAQSRQDVFGQMLSDALESPWSLQRQLAAVVIEEFVIAPGVYASSPDFVQTLADSVLAVLTGSNANRGHLGYADMDRTLHYVRDCCAVLLTTVQSDGKIDTIPVLPEIGAGFTAALAAQLDTELFDQLVARISPRVLTARVKATLNERRQRVQSAIDYYQRQQRAFDVSTNAALAGAIIAIGNLPPKLNVVLRSIMAAIKCEPSALLQTRAAQSAARMAALCYRAESPRPAPADKMVKNLATFVCSDPWTTPVFEQRASQTLSILMLEVVQRSQAMCDLARHQHQKLPGHSSTLGTPTNSVDASMAAAAAASAQASQRKRRGKADSAPKPKELIPLVQAAAMTEEQEQDQAAQLIVRGAEAALKAIAETFAEALVRDVPKLWECVSIPLTRVFGEAPASDSGEVALCTTDTLDAADKSFGENPAVAQQVIDALRVLLTLAPSLDAKLHPALVSALPWAMNAVMSKYSAVRHMAAKTIAGVSKVMTVETMQAFIQNVLPSLADTTLTHRRQGVAETIYYIIQNLDEAVLPYVTFLMVPVLGRMSDVDEQTRLVCTNCFAQLLKLVPLEADIPDPPGISAELVAKREHERRFLAQLMDSSKLEPFKIPVRINATLRKYQQEGVDWLAFLNKYELHGILCDDMGLGKTLQTICIIVSDHYLRSQKFKQSQGRAADCRPLPSLVVCPPTLISHWEQEILHFSQDLRPLCYAGPPNERRELVSKIANNAADVVIMSYDVVRNDIDYLIGQNWNYCVLDEGHCIKNAKTKLTQAVKRVHARRRLILSGTPVQNNVIELWSLFDFLMPGFLGTERQFNELYTKPILASRDSKQSSQTHINGEIALKALHKQVLPFLLRRMKEDVLQDLPPKIIQDYYCDLSPLQSYLYNEFAKSAVTGNLKKSLGISSAEEPDSSSAPEDSKKKTTTHVFQALQYLRKLCNHPALVLSPKHPLYNDVVSDLEKRGADLHSLDIAPKMQALKDLLNQCGIGVHVDSTAVDLTEDSISASHRVLIFCQHKEMIERIEQDLFHRNMPDVSYMRVDGTVEARRRQEIVTQFNSDPSIDCLLLTTHVGGLGLNLTGADTVIFVEHDYNPAMDLQAMDRAHRLGQTRVVNVYRLITRNTLEEKIMGLQAFKLHMANTIVNQQNSGLSSMNTDQLLDLFNISPPETAKADSGPSDGPTKSISKAIEGLDELWDTSQYEDEYNLDNFISSLQQ